MARPTKQGIDYFPLDIEWDGKTEMYLAENEAIGLAVLITLWQLIYKNGYYINSDEDLHLLIKRRINVDKNLVVACINSMLKRGIYDKELYEKQNILTSKAIQKRYFIAAKRKKNITYNSNYMLIDVSEYNNLVNVCNNSVFVCNNATNVKEEVKEEVKEDDVHINDSETIEEELKNKPKEEEVIKYGIAIGLTNDEAKEFYLIYDSQGWKTAGEFRRTFNWRAKIKLFHLELQRKARDETLKNGNKTKAKTLESIYEMRK